MSSRALLKILEIEYVSLLFFGSTMSTKMYLVTLALVHMHLCNN